jgi:proteasome accessory factor C
MTSDRTALRLTRLLGMLPWVMAHPGATIEEVRERFDYRTTSEVIKDLQLVFVCGLPGYGPGDLMDAYVIDDEVVIEAADYFGRPLRLNAEEALVLLAAGSAVMESPAAPPELGSAVRKLREVVAPGDERLTVDLGDQPTHADPLRQAAAEGRVVEIDYTSLGSGATTHRAIEPWTVFSSLGNWYVRAHCRLAGDERLFRLDRVRHVRPTDERFERPVDADVPDDLYSPSADDVHATIELAPAARWVIEYFPVTVLEEGPDGIVIEFAASVPQVTARLLLRLGDDARLLEGDEVRAATVELRERILARYE